MAGYRRYGRIGGYGSATAAGPALPAGEIALITLHNGLPHTPAYTRKPQQGLKQI